ncbi:aldoketomutase [Vibrio inusitatus NBRC 102082]|uniref:Bleomycin resistance protein n=1 Tax=Vibrio inusitatus NBRC 102082 TaxID=1219070 RepID=A0A4Y3HTA5_9VIBR|nr:VOC family protein [Vibrio inusitatus]GEA50379.1 aldoketomutase [Vibrio inusitatus NBRC 102082]
MTLRVVPELYCRNIEVNKQFFVNVLNFSVKYERLDEQFLYLTKDGVDLMLEGIDGDSRKWLLAEPEFPFGRGVNFQWDVTDIETLYAHITIVAKDAIYLELETKSYLCDSKVAVQKQFIAQTPDGYLFRFCEDVLD